MFIDMHRKWMKQIGLVIVDEYRTRIIQLCFLQCNADKLTVVVYIHSRVQHKIHKVS